MTIKEREPEDSWDHISPLRTLLPADYDYNRAKVVKLVKAAGLMALSCRGLCVRIPL